VVEVVPEVPHDLVEVVVYVGADLDLGEDRLKFRR
jgi:hypothetical protein